jgi:hypothetical protein
MATTPFAPVKESRIVLFHNQSGNEKMPALRGEIELCSADLRWLAEELQRGAPLKLEVAIWQKVSRSGKNFLSGAVRKPREQNTREASPFEL